MKGRCILKAATVFGVEAVPVDVEVGVSNGIPGFAIVGMADASVQESRERVKAALRSCGFTMPASKVIVNLAPGTLRKTGTGFDLPIAAGILCATGQIDPRVVDGLLLVGELSLEGKVRPVAGLLPQVLCARSLGYGVVCAYSDGLMAIEGVEQREIRSLSDLRTLPLPLLKQTLKESHTDVLDFRDIAGHSMAKRALQIAAAGGHGVLMMGPPGSGKTMLASRMPSILPLLTRDEVLEAAVIHSVAGEGLEKLLSKIRPFRKPHHSATMPGLVGGGTPIRPGEISLAHRGILFLDELTEFTPSVLQGIRQPLELGSVTITRAEGTIIFPANFMLIAASNPCPCGYYGDKEQQCTCTQQQIRSYQSKIGGPVMDRIDIHVDVKRIPPSEVLATGCGTSSESLREGVLKAREYASWRTSKAGEAQSGSSETLVKSCELNVHTEKLIEQLAHQCHMSGRGIIRTLSLARTIADMEEKQRVEKHHICEAIGYRLRQGDS